MTYLQADLTDRINKLNKKVELLGGKVVMKNSWAAVFLHKGEFQIYNAYLDRLIPGTYTNCVVYEYFIVSERSEAATRQIGHKLRNHKQLWVMQDTKDKLSRYTRAVNIQQPHSKDAKLILIERLGLGLTIINYTGKVKSVGLSTTGVPKLEIRELDEKTYRMYVNVGYNMISNYNVPNINDMPLFDIDINLNILRIHSEEWYNILNRNR